jgi:hypothetical protein
MPKKLTDIEAYDVLHAAILALGSGEGETVRADTALKAARRALFLIQIGLLKASDESTDTLSTIKAQGEP